MALTKIPASLLDTASGLDLQGNITLGASEEIQFGGASELKIFNDGNNSVLRSTDNLLIQRGTSPRSAITVIDSTGEVALAYGGSTVFQTSSTGATVTGTLTVTGDLDITGNINSYNVTDLDVTDQTITLGAGQTEANSGGSGIIIDGSNASILWDETNTEFDINNPIHVAGGITFGTSDSTLADNNVRFKSTGAAYIDHNTVGQDINFRISNASALDTTIMTLDAGVGSVGINQTSPSSTYKLDVGGAIRSSAPAPSLTLRETDASNQDWLLGSYGGTFAIRDVTGGTYPVYVEAATPSSTLYLDSTGNVGIGTSSPAAGLQVSKGLTNAGGPAAGASTAAACFGNEGSDDNYGLVLGADGFGDGYISAQRTDGTATTYDLFIQPNGGNVGIGRSGNLRDILSLSKSDTTTTFGATTASIDITNSYASAFNSYSGVNFRVGGGAYNESLASVQAQYKAYSGNVIGELVFGTRRGSTTDVTEAMRIDSSGNLLVGTLTSYGPSGTTIESDGNFRNVLASGTGGDTLISAIYGVSNGYQISIDSSNNQTYRWHNGGPASMVLDSSGNLGIGTTPPSGVRTKIKGLAEATNLATSATSAALFIEPYSGSSWGLGIGSISGQKQYIQGVSAAGDSSRELLINPYGGNVGIGTDSAYYAFHIHHPTPRIQLKDTSSSGEAYLQLDGVALSLANTATNGPLYLSTNNPREEFVYINGTAFYSESFNLNNGIQYDFDIDVPDEGGYGNSFFIIAGYAHNNASTYAAHTVKFIATRSTGLATIMTIGDQTSTGGGAWQISKADNTTLRLRKTAGTYVGSGSGFITVIFRNAIG